MVRAVLRQPWAVGDLDALSAALTRLVADVLTPSLAGQLDRVGQEAPLAAVAVRVALPAQMVLGLADEATASQGGRRLTSFGAELAVHAATSSAVREAVERQGAGPGGPGQMSQDAAGQPTAEEADVLGVSGGGRLLAAVRGTLLAAWRHGRLRHLLGRCDPALLAEWARLLSVQRAREPDAPPEPGGLCPSGLAATAAAAPGSPAPPGPGGLGPYGLAATAAAAPGSPAPAIAREGSAASAGAPLAEPAVGASAGLAVGASAGLAGRPSADALPTGPADAAFEAILDVLAATAPPGSTGTAAAGGSPVTEEAGVLAASGGGRLPAAVRGTLLAAWRHGRLRHLLGRCDPALLAEWARLLSVQRAGEPDAPPEPGGPGRSGLAAADATVAPGSPAPPAAVAGEGPAAAAGGPSAGLAGGPSADALPTGPADAAFEAILDVLAATADARPMPVPRSPGADAAVPPPGSADSAFEAITDILAAMVGAPPKPLPAHPFDPDVVRAGRLRPVAGLELELASVLPFLLVGPLEELGVLDAVTAALAGPDWPDLMAAFAGCLARKALPPPTAGWLYPPEVTATVAAFTGQVHAPDGSDCERLGRTVPHWWPIVQEAVAAELTELRAEGAPLVATPSPGGLVLADADGLVPLLWDADADAARRLWEVCGRPQVLVHPALAPAELQDFRTAPDRVHTRPLADQVALIGRRPASGRAGLAPELEAPFGLLASVALAALAWELWHRHGERTHPALAIERLGDLDGRVRLGPDSVTVQMPIGRRHADLRDSGLLRTVDEVPWLQGRRLELLGG